MDYFKSDTPIRLREYGRNIQRMIEHTAQIEDYERRSRYAQEVVRVMTIIVPNAADLAEYKKKLWDHFYRIAEYDIDIRAPFPPPAHRLEDVKHEKVEYYPFKSRYKQYGKNVELMIEKALLMQQGSARDEYILLIANTMKMFLQNYASNTPNDEVVFEHLGILSRGQIILKSEDLALNRVPVVQGLPNQNRATEQRNQNRRFQDRRLRQNNNGQNNHNANQQGNIMGGNNNMSGNNSGNNNKKRKNFQKKNRKPAGNLY